MWFSCFSVRSAKYVLKRMGDAIICNVQNANMISVGCVLAVCSVWLILMLLYLVLVLIRISINNNAVQCKRTNV